MKRAKGYWVAHVSATDPVAYRQYAEGATAAFAKYGAKVLARGGHTRNLEGAAHERNVVIEFESIDAAQRCYDSPEYQAARIHRVNAAIIQLMLVEGVSE